MKVVALTEVFTKASDWRQGDYKQLKIRRLNEYLKYLLPRALARG